jgi:hypothetical protein
VSSVVIFHSHFFLTNGEPVEGEGTEAGGVGLSGVVGVDVIPVPTAYSGHFLRIFWGITCTT